MKERPLEERKRNDEGGFLLHCVTKSDMPGNISIKKQITIRIAANTIKYFKDLSGDMGIPYQNLIDSYLGDCAQNQRKLSFKWG